MYKFVVLLGFILIINCPQSRAQEKLVKKKVDEHISLKVPVSFVPMNENDMWLRVSSYRKAIALYTDIDRLAELGVNRSYSVWDGEDYQMMYDVYKSSILQLYDQVEFFKEEITKIKKRTFVVFEFVSTIKADQGTSSGPIQKYTYIQYTINKGQTLVFDFSCPRYQMKKWRTTANSIMNSVVVR